MNTCAEAKCAEAKRVAGQINLPQLKGAMNGECGNNGISVSQIPSKSAIATLINVNDGYTAVTSDGLQQLEVE